MYVYVAYAHVCPEHKYGPYIRIIKRQAWLQGGSCSRRGEPASSECVHFSRALAEPPPPYFAQCMLDPLRSLRCDRLTECKPVNNKDSSKPQTQKRYSLQCGDGSYQARVMVATQMNQLLEEGRLRKGCIVAIEDFIVNEVNGKRCGTAGARQGVRGRCLCQALTHRLCLCRQSRLPLRGRLTPGLGTGACVWCMQHGPCACPCTHAVDGFDRR